MNDLYLKQNFVYAFKSEQKLRISSEDLKYL